MLTSEPLFIFGFERSGTTLLSMMVGAHPKIAVPLSPTGLWYRYAARLDEYDGLDDRESITRIVEDLRREERIQMWDEELMVQELIPRTKLSSYASVVEAFHAAYAAKKGKPFWASIDISTLYMMDQANSWFPGAKFLHIVRDGRDVALSHETYKYGLATTTEVADHWAHDLQTNMKMGGMIDPKRYKVIRYEDLVMDPQTTLNEICAFIGVEYSDAMLDYPQMVDKKVPQDRRFLWPTLHEPPKKSNAYRWKNGMSQVKRTVFERRANKMLGQLGYECYQQVPASVGAYLYDFWCYLGEGGRINRLKAVLGIRKD